MTFIVKCAPLLKEWNFCCCSCNLRAAAVILAWIEAVRTVSQFVSCVCYMNYFNPYPEIPYEVKQIFISILSTTIGTLILDMLLLYGIHSKKSVYMLPFLVLGLIGIVVLMAFVVIGGIVLTVINWRIGLIILIVGFAALVIATFFWVVIYSYYRQVEEEKNGPYGTVNHTYGIPDGQVQILQPQDQKGICPSPTKVE